MARSWPVAQLMERWRARKLAEIVHMQARESGHDV
jgi:hypothetical protein